LVFQRYWYSRDIGIPDEVESAGNTEYRDIGTEIPQTSDNTQDSNPTGINTTPEIQIPQESIQLHEVRLDIHSNFRG